MSIKRTLIILSCASTALLIIYFGWAKEFIAIDRCLDSGGAYDVQQQVCERDE
jgi:hypothetical protein